MEPNIEEESNAFLIKMIMQIMSEDITILNV